MKKLFEVILYSSVIILDIAALILNFIGIKNGIAEPTLLRIGFMVGESFFIGLFIMLLKEVGDVK